MSTKSTNTIKGDTIRLLTRKRPMTYEAIVKEIKAKHPGAQTSVKTVQWYASRLRADGTEVNVKKMQGGRPAAERPSKH